MKSMLKITLAIGLIATAATPAFAWKLMKRNEVTQVGSSGLSVSPGEDWNRIKPGYIGGSEVWTLDGISLNQIYLVGALPAGKTLLPDMNRKDQPLPRFADTMTLTDLPAFVESTWRIARKATVFTLGDMVPVKLGQQNAVRFTFEYAAEGNTLRYRGVATAAVINKTLYFIEFEAPAAYYYDRDAAKATAVMDSAKLS